MDDDRIPARSPWWLETLWEVSLLTFTALLIALLMAAMSHGANPVPAKKAPVKPVPIQLVPGEYLMSWAGSELPTPLDNGGGYKWGTVWYGSYAWDKTSRTLTITETMGDGWHTWEVILDKDGKGTSTGYWPGIKVQVRKKP